MECGEWTLESVNRLEMESIERGKECGGGGEDEVWSVWSRAFGFTGTVCKFMPV